MRKIMFIAAGFLLSSAAFYSCSLLNSLKEVQDNGFSCMRYDMPANMMDKTEVLDMIRNYYMHQYKALHDQASASKLTGLDPNCLVDARAVFFNLDTLKKLIYFVEQASKNYTEQVKKNLGLNIYFASYPKSQNKMHENWSYTNRHTLIFIPAIFDGLRKTPRDIDLQANLGGGMSDPAFIDSAFFSGPQAMMIALGAGTSSTASGGSPMTSQNNGTGTPPPPSSNTILNMTDPY